MSVALISVSQDTVVSNKHEERTRHYYVIFQQFLLNLGFDGCLDDQLKDGHDFPWLLFLLRWG